MDNPFSSPPLPLLKPPSTFTCWQSSPISTIAQFDGQDGMKRSTLGFNASVRSDLQLADEEGVECLPNSTIFEQLALMGVLDLEKTKTTQHNEIASLKRRVKKLEKKNRPRSEDASKRGRIDAINVDEEITLVSVQNVDEEMFDVNVLDGEEVFVTEQEVAANKENDEGNVVSIVGDETTVIAATTTTAIITTVDDITLAQALMEIKKPVKPMKNKDLIRLDEEVALSYKLNLMKKKDLQERKLKKEANIALIEEWDDIQAKIDADYQLAKIMQAQEQEELSIEENATLFQQLLEKRRNHFAAKRAKEKRNKPPTKAR
ncbi:hypothetical protein Tco_0830459 [Tanacetum coccineum]